MFLLSTVFNILVRNASPRGPMCFRCLIFSSSGPCELLFFVLLLLGGVVAVSAYMHGTHGSGVLSSAGDV